MPADAEPIMASCAICGAPPEPECPHEHERLKLALDQAAGRWTGFEAVRRWVLEHARRHVIATFHALADARHQQFREHLQTLPCYTVYHRYNGAPPLPPAEIAQLVARINHARATYQAAIDADWRRCCQRYPDILDYFFGLVEIKFPRDDDDAVRRPRFTGGGVPAIPGAGAVAFAVPPPDPYAGAAAAAAAAERAAIAAAAAGYLPRVATRRRSSGSLDRKEHRRKEKRRPSRERTPPAPSHVPPVAPMPGHYYSSHSHSRRERY